MAAKYRKIDPRIWTDEKFTRLDRDGKLLALWLLSSTRLNRCGIVQWSPALCAEETGIDRKRVDTVLDTVCHTVSWTFCRQSNTLFLGRWWRYNRPDNESALKGALADLHDLPANSLKPALSRASADLPTPLRQVYHTVLDTVYHTVSPQEQYQEQEQETPQPPASGGRDSTEAVAIPVELDTADFRSAWSEWKAERRAKRMRPYTARGEAQQLAKLAPFGPAESIRAIRDSIAQGWQGLFPKTAEQTKPRGGFQTPGERVLLNLQDSLRDED